MPIDVEGKLKIIFITPQFNESGTPTGEVHVLAQSTLPVESIELKFEITKGEAQ